MQFIDSIKVLKTSVTKHFLAFVLSSVWCFYGNNIDKSKEKYHCFREFEGVD